MITVSYAKDLAVTNHYDVVVVGSGPAGICAAVASARMGAKTLIIERYGILGGNLTSGNVGPIMGVTSGVTLGDELVALLETKTNSKMHDIELAKGTLPKWLTEAGVHILLQTPMVDTIVENETIRGVVVGTGTGLQAVFGKTIIDATGDGQVAFLAGAPYEKGRDSDGRMQPVSNMFTISGVDEEIALVCTGERSNVELNGERYVDFCHRAHANGLLPENVSIVRLYRTVNPGERMVNATQANGIDATLPSDILRAENILRQQIACITSFLREHVPGYQNCVVKASASTLGVRETRRVMGQYVLQDEDLLSGRKFADVMVHNARFVIDIHNPTGGGQAEGLAAQVQPYDIPYRCFVTQKVNNLMVAGRCISGTHRAHASYRVMKICMSMGQAVGIAAALSGGRNITPGALDYREVQRELASLGVDLFQ